MNGQALDMLPKDIDPLTMHDDTKFLDMLKENQSSLAYLINGLNPFLQESNWY